ncbi:MAG TPA: hypothetical protein VMU59_04355 [Caulobacteraceae bacterium]|nr:hypothetical protein [Caulobacteraceae bacterium]
MPATPRIPAAQIEEALALYKAALAADADLSCEAIRRDTTKSDHSS